MKEETDKKRKVTELVPVDADKLSEATGGVQDRPDVREWGWWFAPQE